MTLEDCVTYLTESKGWGDNAARGVASSLDLDGEDVLPWGKDRRGLLHDYASGCERNPKYHSTQLAFVDWELRGAFMPIGREVMLAPTEAVEAEAFQQYRKAARR